MNDTLKLCYWIQGFVEIVNKTPTVKQWKEIRGRIEECELDDQSGDGAMSAETFMTWIKGFIELAEPTSLTDQQWAVIKEHLQLVFTKVTVETVDEGDDIHDILEQIQKDRDNKMNPPLDPWKSPPPYINPTPFNPGDVICSTDDKLDPNGFCVNGVDVACSTANPNGTANPTGTSMPLDDDAITLTAKSSKRRELPQRSRRLCSSPSEKTYCATMPKAHEMYLADPVN